MQEVKLTILWKPAQQIPQDSLIRMAAGVLERTADEILQLPSINIDGTNLTIKINPINDEPI